MSPDSQPSTFTELFSNNPDSRLFDVFIVGREYDYPMTDLSNVTGLSRQRLKAKISFCLSKKLIIKTRNHIAPAAPSTSRPESSYIALEKRSGGRVAGRRK